MEASLQAVLLFHNHQAITPHVPFAGQTTPTTASAPAPPLRKRDRDDEDEDNDKDKDDKEKDDVEKH